MSKLRKPSRASSISELDLIFTVNPDAFAIGAEYDPGTSPQELIAATCEWERLMNGRSFGVKQNAIQY